MFQLNICLIYFIECLKIFVFCVRTRHFFLIIKNGVCIKYEIINVRVKFTIICVPSSIYTPEFVPACSS